jgi:hypothetical protein
MSRRHTVEPVYVKEKIAAAYTSSAPGIDVFQKPGAATPLVSTVKASPYYAHITAALDRSFLNGGHDEAGSRDQLLDVEHAIQQSGAVSARGPAFTNSDSGISR